MAVSKKRKVSKNKPRRQVMHPMAGPKSSIWRAQLNGSRLHFLKQDPDFLAMIKMGRVVNTTLFAVQCMADHMREVNPMEMRQNRRAFFVLGGYIHEGLVLSKALQGRYLGIPEFEPLRLLVHDSKHKKAREYIKAVRNSTAFHLDEYDTTTRQTLSEMKLTWYDLVSGDDKNTMNVYFEFPDIVDFGYLVRKFGSIETWQQTAKEIYDTILAFSTEFAGATNIFMQYLMAKTNIKEHIKGGYLPASFVERAEKKEEAIMAAAEKKGEE